MDYQEKLRLAKEALDSSCYDKETIEYIFPELRETEDERIRKALIHYFSEQDGILTAINGVYTKDVITWLEKQSNHNEENYWEKCKSCQYFDGYDICLHRKNFGSITDESKENCKNKKFFIEKQREPQDKGEISDGYHTFNELYYYRMLYNAAFFNMLPKEWVHKSKKHHDGEECFGGGWFIVMANLPTGQISNHYELKDWNLFQIPEKEVADEWDGHTPQEAADRLYKYLLEKQGEYKSADKKYTFNAIPRLLDMIQPTDGAKAYCQKLIDSLIQEGYGVDAKIVGNCLKQMNDEKVAMATMDEQNPAGWSKEDDKMLTSFLHKVEVCDLLSNKESVWILKKLKSLKPQTYWRPSDEQMRTLEYYLNVLNCNEHKEILFGLYEELKSL